jgi:hypothetical protein
MSRTLPCRLLACVILAIAALAPDAALAAGKSASCSHFIDALPASIDSSGTWCLAGNLSTSMSTGHAIDVVSDDVTLDCNGFGVASTSPSPASGEAVNVVGRRNFVMRNCNMRGFRYGVYIGDGNVATNAGHLVEDNTFSQSSYVGIHVDAASGVIRRNRVIATHADSGGGAAFGIQSYGTVDVVDNTVQDVVAYDAAVAGILVNSNLGGSVRGNRVSGLARPTGSGLMLGIRTQNNSSRVILRGNVVIGDGITPSFGIACDNVNQVAKSNSISGFETALGCTDNGNVIKP